VTPPEPDASDDRRPVDVLTSVRNPRVQRAAELQRSRGRREQGRHLVEGPHAVAEALAAGVVEQLFVTPDRAGDYAGTVERVVAADHVVQRLGDAVTSQGVVAVARTQTVPLASVVGRGLLVVLDQVADPGNAGTILRTADAAGATGVVLTAGSVDPFNPKAVRAAAGSTYHLPVVVDVSPAQRASACRTADQPLYGLDQQAESDVFGLEPTASAALVLGSEAHGLSPAMGAALDARVAIPIWGRAESLNVAAAAAIAVYAVAAGLRAAAAP
jgi:TrmH family RNA methyltransferase